MEALGRRQGERADSAESTLEHRPGQAAVNGGGHSRWVGPLWTDSFVTFCTVTSCYRISRNGLLRAVTEGCKTIRTRPVVIGIAQTGACTVA